jgi:LPS export ABC transporter permease LptF/LPS export ABC transporter permease LptG
MRLIDRYVIREILPPFLLALAIFTFIMAINPMLSYAEDYLAKGVPIGTVAILLLNLLPQALGVTLPMAVLTGILMALGRMSADREPVALLSCGVSPLRLLPPILVFAGAAAALNLYTMIRLVPDANQTFREITYRHLVQRTESDIKPGVFYEGFPNTILLVQDVQPGGRWRHVMLADATHQDRLSLTFAEAGRLELDPVQREVRVLLSDATRYVQGANDDSYAVFPDQHAMIRISAESVFGDGTLMRGLAEMTVADLEQQIEVKRTRGESPHNEIMYIQQKFAFPAACLTFALLGLSLGLHTRQEGKFAGLALGLGVILIYMALHAQAEDWTKGGDFPAVWARWLPNLVLAPLALVALWWRRRAVGRDLAISWPAVLSRVRRVTGRRRRQTPLSNPAPVKLIIRLPAVTLWRPRLLDLYVMQRYARLLGLTFVALMLLNYVGTFLDESEYLFKGQASWRLLLAHLYYLTPQFAILVVPVSVLVAGLATIGGLVRTGELTVMRACGVSLYRAAVPLLGFAAVGAAVLFLVDDRVLAQANDRADDIRAEIRQTMRPSVQFQRLNWQLGGQDQSIHHYAGFDIAQTRVIRPSILRIASDPFRLESHTTAADAIFDEGVWRASDGWIQRFPTPRDIVREPFTTRVLPLPPPREFLEARSTNDPETFRELRDYVRRYEGRGMSLTSQWVDLHKKVAMPAATLVMTLLAIPFGLTTGRRGALYGIGLAIALAFGHQLLAIIFTAAGQAALLPPWLAAWSANILFMAGALYLMFTVRT